MQVLIRCRGNCKKTDVAATVGIGLIPRPMPTVAAADLEERAQAVVGRQCYERRVFVTERQQ